MKSEREFRYMSVCGLLNGVRGWGDNLCIIRGLLLLVNEHRQMITTFSEVFLSVYGD